VSSVIISFVHSRLNCFLVACGCVVFVFLFVSKELAVFYAGLHARFASTMHWEGNVVLTFEGGKTAHNKSYWQGISDGQIVAMVS
jgi:hypothetical protein